MAAGDETFSREAIELSADRLLSFLARVDAVRGDPTALRGVFQSLISEFNAINKNHGWFIETLERDELVSFFNAVADAVGLEYADGDVTLEWRDSW